MNKVVSELKIFFKKISEYFKPNIVCIWPIFNCPTHSLLIVEHHISFLILSNKVEKCLCIRFICLFVIRVFVCLPVCAHYNSRKHSSNTLELIYVIQVYYTMSRIENDAF